jgi:hypothetical protein
MRAAQPFLRGELIHSTNHSALSETLRSGSWTMLHCTHKHQHIPLAPCLFAPTLMRGFFYGCCSWKNLSTFCLRLLPNPLLPTCCFWIRTSQTSMMASGFVGCPPLRHFHARLHADVSAGLRLSAASAASWPLPLHCARFSVPLSLQRSPLNPSPPRYIVSKMNSASPDMEVWPSAPLCCFLCTVVVVSWKKIGNGW